MPDQAAWLHLPVVFHFGEVELDVALLINMPSLRKLCGIKVGDREGMVEESLFFSRLLR